MPTPETQAPGLRYVEVNGYPLAYREEGDGPPLLLIHGSLSDYRSWDQQLRAFSARFRTIAVSLRHSYPERWDGVGADFTVAQHASDLASYISRRALDRVHVVGHSRGGCVALVLALRYSDRVRSLVLADPGGLEALLPDTPEGRRMAGESLQMFAQLKENLARLDPQSAARAFVEALNGPGAWDKRANEQKQVLLDNIATGPACAERPSITCNDIAALRVPILPLSGERSPRRYGLMLAALKACASGAVEPVTIPGAAHAMHRDNPAAFNHAVLQFLSKYAQP